MIQTAANALPCTLIIDDISPFYQIKEGTFVEKDISCDSKFMKIAMLEHITREAKTIEFYWTQTNLSLWNALQAKNIPKQVLQMKVRVSGLHGDLT